MRIQAGPVRMDLVPLNTVIVPQSGEEITVLRFIIEDLPRPILVDSRLLSI